MSNLEKYWYTDHEQEEEEEEKKKVFVPQKWIRQ
jgi:hypothetical protein